MKPKLQDLKVELEGVGPRGLGRRYPRALVFRRSRSGPGNPAPRRFRRVLAVVSPSGWRIEGLSLARALEVIGQMAC